jgi:hypothetical protein
MHLAVQPDTDPALVPVRQVPLPHEQPQPVPVPERVPA